MTFENTKQLAEKLITYKSTSNNLDECKSIIDFCGAYILQHTNKSAVIEYFQKNKKYSLVASNKDTKHFDVLLQAHLDVIDAPDSDFIPYEKNGKLYGRGASDMKAVAAVLINIFCMCQDSGLRIGLMLTTDEEVGGADGVRFLVHEKKFHADCVILPDGGDNWQLTVVEKGIVHVKLSIFGTAAHGSRPWLGDNAIEKSYLLLQKIKNEFNVSNTEGWHETVTVGKLVAGQETNKVPEKAEMYLDIRFTEKYSLSQVKRMLQNCIAKDAHIEFIAEGEVNAIDINNEIITDFATVTQQVLGKKITTLKAHGASDGRHFAAKDIPTIIIKPPCGNQHGDDEWVSIVGLEQFQKIVYTFVQERSITI